MNPTSEDWAWAAGIIDGEGHLGLYQNNGNTWSYVDVGMKGIPILTRLEQLFGGRIYPQWHGDTYKGKRWTLARPLQESFLKGVLPFLVLKQRQAEILLAFLEERGDCKSRGGQRPTDDATNLLHETLVRMIWEEHHKWTDEIREEIVADNVDDVKPDLFPVLSFEEREELGYLLYGRDPEPQRPEASPEAKQSYRDKMQAYWTQERRDAESARLRSLWTPAKRAEHSAKLADFHARRRDFWSPERRKRHSEALTKSWAERRQSESAAVDSSSTEREG